MNAAAAWGKLAAEILSGNWDGAMEELNKVKEIINDRVLSLHLNPSNSSLSPIPQSNCTTEPG
jgi:translation initiation factor 3 subunit E